MGVSYVYIPLAISNILHYWTIKIYRSHCIAGIVAAIQLCFGAMDCTVTVNHTCTKQCSPTCSSWTHEYVMVHTIMYTPLLLFSEKLRTGNNKIFIKIRGSQEHSKLKSFGPFPLWKTWSYLEIKSSCQTLPRGLKKNQISYGNIYASPGE